MARPSGRTKIERVTVNLDGRVYAVLLTIAGSEDVPVGRVAHYAVMDDLVQQEPELRQPGLPLMRSITAQAEGRRR